MDKHTTVLLFFAVQGLIAVVAKGGATVISESMARVEAAASKIPGAKILNDIPNVYGYR